MPSSHCISLLFSLWLCMYMQVPVPTDTCTHTHTHTHTHTCVYFFADGHEHVHINIRRLTYMHVSQWMCYNSFTRALNTHTHTHTHTHTYLHTDMGTHIGVLPWIYHNSLLPEHMYAHAHTLLTNMWLSDVIPIFEAKLHICTSTDGCVCIP